MTAISPTLPQQVSADEIVTELANSARAAQRQLASMPSEARAAALHHAADQLRRDVSVILEANAKDLAAGKTAGLPDAMLDRLALDEVRVEGIATGVDAVAQLSDPVGQIVDTSERPNGLQLSRIRVPIGVIGLIYESRPNVTADAAALCVRAGNAALLRGGSEAVHSNHAIHAAMTSGLVQGGVPAASVQIMPTQDRAMVGAMLSASGLIDMIVPRGGKGLVARVQADARVPVLAHLDGICHTYVHADANPAMAQEIVLNAKMRRTGICGAMETLLIDAHFPKAADLVKALLASGCEVRGDGRAQSLDPRIEPAGPEDWDTEYLDAVVSAAIVDNMGDALSHIAEHSSAHTDAIITEDHSAAERFFANVDSAIVMHNASSQFADGAEFGLGAEIGIATGRLHARGPVALEGLTTYKWLVRGTGQARP